MKQPVQCLGALVAVEEDACCPLQWPIPLAVELELLRSGLDIGGGVLRFQFGTGPVNVVLVTAFVACDSGDGLEPDWAEIPVHGGRHDAGLARTGDGGVQADVAGIRAVVRPSQSVVWITQRVRVQRPGDRGVSGHAVADRALVFGRLGHQREIRLTAQRHSQLAAESLEVVVVQARARAQVARVTVVFCVGHREAARHIVRASAHRHLRATQAQRAGTNETFRTGVCSGCARHHVDGATRRIAAIQGSLRAFQHLDTLQIEQFG